MYVIPQNIYSVTNYLIGLGIHIRMFMMKFIL